MICQRTYPRIKFATARANKAQGYFNNTTNRGTALCIQGAARIKTTIKEKLIKYKSLVPNNIKFNAKCCNFKISLRAVLHVWLSSIKKKKVYFCDCSAKQ